MTMTFAVMGLGTVFNALTNRRYPTTGLTPPVLKALLISAVPDALVFLATELPRLQGALLTTSLTGLQWLAVIGLALLRPVSIATSKWVRRRRAVRRAPVDVVSAVTPGRAVVTGR